ncbi:uncharacterized protein LOC135388324 [Ornithodoros turicata]|uniref:uncharacterized protein LOC135388324 n=1 Tax=Ornithodoros turicata TaxID=34597 RepID=UPI003139C241
MGSGSSAAHETFRNVSLPQQFPNPILRSSGLLSPAPPLPIASPPPRPAGRTLPSPPSPSGTRGVPIVKATLAESTVSANNNNNNDNMWADTSHHSRTNRGDTGILLSEEQPGLKSVRNFRHRDSDELDKQIREIEQMTEGILEDVEDADLFSKSPVLEQNLSSKNGLLERLQMAPTNYGAKLMVQPKDTVHTTRNDGTRLVERPPGSEHLSRALPPTRSIQHRRASVPRESVLTVQHRIFANRGFTGETLPGRVHSHRHVIQDIKSRQQVVRRLNATCVPVLYPRQEKEEEKDMSYNKPDVDVNFEKFKQVNSRLTEQQDSDAEPVPVKRPPEGQHLHLDHGVRDSTLGGEPASVTVPRQEPKPPDYDEAEDLILKEIEKEFIST